LWQLTPSHRDVAVHTDILITPRPAFAGCINEHDPFEIVLLRPIDNEVRPALPLRRQEGDRRINSKNQRLTMDRLAVPDIIEDFRRYHSANPAWGSLHIVLGDSNVRDCYVDFCIGWAQEKNDVEGERLARILRRLSRTQRLKIGRLA
jgi:hypothetical protein